PTALRHQLAAAAQEQAAVGTLPLRITGREMGPDIAHGQGSEHGVAQRVQRHVTITVGHECAVVRDAYTANHHMIALAKGMHIKALANTERNAVCHPAMLPPTRPDAVAGHAPEPYRR